MQTKVNQAKVIEALRSEAKANPAIADVFLMLSARARPRHELTLLGLRIKMHEEQFPEAHEAEYPRFFRFLENLGFGIVTVDLKGQPDAITELNTTLQSIGKVALGQENVLQPYSQRKRDTRVLRNLPRSAPTHHSPPSPVALGSRPPKPPGAPRTARPQNIMASLSVNLTINGKVMEVKIPSDITPEELTSFLARFQGIVNS